MVIEDMRFHNGPAMFPHHPSSAGGGVFCNSLDDSVILRRCVFDSTYTGLSGLFGPTILDNCRFWGSQWVCVGEYTHSGLKLYATDCSFSGHGWDLVECADSSKLRRCTFGVNPWDPPLRIAGMGVVVENCIFTRSGLQDTSPYEAIQMQNGSSTRIEGNLFEDLFLGDCAVHLSCSCPDSTVVRGNSFVRNRPGNAQVNGSVQAWCSCVIIEDNIFYDNVVDGVCRGVMLLAGGGRINSNRFRNLRSSVFAAPTIYATSAAQVNYNRFDSTGYALLNLDSNHVLDAIHNWWGDSSGPFNHDTNPSGRGDTVSNGVNFDPWYHDTLFFSDTPEPRPLLPKSNKLEAYPNPFNPIARIKLTVAEPLIVRLELFNILGRKVSELWSGPVGIDKEISFNASELQLASGVYFVKATDTIYNRPIASSKLILLK
jgi:hypothetical protein